MDWNVLDVLFAAIVLFFAVRGVFRGFIGEVFAWRLGGGSGRGPVSPGPSRVPSRGRSG
jgi:hypothetical protein